MFNWKDNTKNTNEELAAAAAEVMYHPGNEKTAPLQYVIQKLVMPKGTSGYTEEQMKEWILDWIVDDVGPFLDDLGISTPVCMSN